MKTTLADIKASRIPECLNMYPDDPRIVEFVNEAVRRLMTRGLYWGAYATYDIALTSRFMTLPPQLETLESIAVSLTPLPIRDTFYQFIDAGWGQRDETLVAGTGISECFYLNNYPVIADITTASVLTVICDLATDATKEILILGYDENNNWVRTLQDGAYADGEIVALAVTPGTNTTTQFSKVTDIQAPSDLDGQWWLYQGATMLGNYQHWETRPSWKRYLVPFADVDETARVVGRRAFIPVSNDNDYPIIGNLAALKLACMAIRAEEEHNWSVSNLLWNGGTYKGEKIVGAMQELDMELQHMLGIGREISIDIRPTPYQDVLETVQ